MLRGEWKDRGANEETEQTMETEDSINESSITESPTSVHEDEGGHTTPPPPYLPHTQTQPGSHQSPATGTAGDGEDQLNGLISSMTSLSLVPPSIRFGRGGRSGGFGTGSGGVNGHGDTHIAAGPQHAANTGAKNVRGGRGRGRGRGFAQSQAQANGNHVVPAQASAVRGAGKTRGVNKTDHADQTNSPQLVKNGGRGGFRGRGGIVRISPVRGRGTPGSGRGRIVPRGRGRGI